MSATHLEIQDRRKGFTLDRDFYVSDEILELDIQKVFFSQWLYVGHESQIPEPGDFVTYQIVGESIVVARTHRAADLRKRSRLSLSLPQLDLRPGRDFDGRAWHDQPTSPGRLRPSPSLGRELARFDLHQPKSQQTAQQHGQHVVGGGFCHGEIPAGQKQDCQNRRLPGAG
jgi:hypothetical protein